MFIKNSCKKPKICYNEYGDIMSEEEINEIFSNSNLDNMLLSRNSSKYREASLVNSLVQSTRTEEQDPLTLALSQATHIPPDTKELYIKLAKLFTSNMSENLFRNQFELNSNYPEASIDTWNDFLADRMVNKYIAKHKRTLLKNIAEDNLANPIAKNKRDNLKLIENLEQQEQRENNKNICILRLPDIYN